jgi:hypothetical protein
MMNRENVTPEWPPWSAGAVCSAQTLPSYPAVYLKQDLDIISQHYSTVQYRYEFLMYITVQYSTE